MNEDFFQNISSTGNPIEYADSVQRYQTQLPLGISWPTVTGSLNPGDLYTDDTSLYMYYPSGVNKTAVAIQQRDRYGGITFTLVSGSTNLYIQASEYFADPNPAFISSPYTVSGEGDTNLISASYLSDTPENPENYWINLPNPGTYKVVFPNPVISTAFSVTHSGSSPYVFSQMLPRKSVGSYDIDVNSIRAYHVTASFIDAVTLQVSDSIVVGPDLIGAKSIDGSKIIDGTLSGVLIQNGTIIGNKILAGTISGVLLQGSTITGDRIQANTISGALMTAGTITATQIAVSGITADRLNVTQLSALTADMGTLTVNSGISIGANGYIWTGTGDVATPTTGLKIYTTDGVSRLTTYADGLAQVDIGSDGKLIAGRTVVDSQGLTVGNIAQALDSSDAIKIMSSGSSGNNGGLSFFNGAYSSTIPQAQITTDSTNNFVISNNVPDGNLIIGNADTGNNSIYLYNSNVNIMPTVSGDVQGIYGYSRDGLGGEAVKYLLNKDGLYLFDDVYDINNEPVPNVILTRETGDIVTAGVVNLSDGSATNPSLTFTNDPDTGFYSLGSNYIRVATEGTQSAIFGLDRFLISDGSVTSPGLQFIGDQNTGMYSVSADVLGFSTGGAQRLSLSNTTANFTGKITSAEMGYLTVRRTGTLAITTAGTTIVWQSVTRSGNISVPVPSDTITIDNAGYYMFSATFATVANLTSLRMSLTRGGANYVSTLHGAGLNTGGGYIFNFNIGFWASGGSTYKVSLTPSSNTTLNVSNEAFAGPSPIMNIFQAIGAQ